MEKEFWLERWEENCIGFHRDEFHPCLTCYFPQLNLKAGSHVLVPLCGKTLDLLWLKNCGHKVTGVEFSPIACETFFKENNLDYNEESVGPYTRYSGENITIYCGDFFELSNTGLPRIDALYDRAAMIALPPGMRKRYAEKICQLLPSGAGMILNTLEYDQSKTSGPPHSVEKNEVFAHYEKAFSIEIVQDEKIEMVHKRLNDAGVFDFWQKTYLLIRR